jgi:hypothetical protein
MGATISQYAFLGLVIGFGAYYYDVGGFHKFIDGQLQGRPQEASSIIPQITKKARQKRAKQVLGDGKDTSPQLSSTESHAAKKRKISGPTNREVKAQTAEGVTATLPRVDKEEQDDDAAFAESLKKAQTGTKFHQPTSQQTTTKKSRRPVQDQSKLTAKEFDSADTSSTGGRDADDDLTPAETPPTSISRAGDVADMLEPSEPKISSLRLTNTESKAKKVAPKQFEAAQTKKQRQRQKQKEENKKAREEADRLQESLKQKQMQGARMAEGTSKQTKATTFTQNAWQSKPTQAQEQQAPAQAPQQTLLDTFDQDENKPAVSAQPAEALTDGPEATASAIKESKGEDKAQALAASAREGGDTAPVERWTSKESWADQINDNEQEQWQQKLVEEEQWEEVTTKKGKKKNKNVDSSSEASQPLSTVPNGQVPTNGTKPSADTNKTTRPQTLNRFESVAGDNWEA